MRKQPRAIHPSEALIQGALALQHPQRKRAKAITKPVKATTASRPKAKAIPFPQQPITFTVFGESLSQGSKNVQMRGGRPILLEGANAAAHARIKAWRKQITDEALLASNGRMLLGSVQVAAKFWTECPKSKQPGDWDTGRRDVDKMCRLVGDSLTDAFVIEDDRYIATWDGSWKRYCRVGEEPRVEIEIIPLRPPIDMEHA